MTMKNFPRSKFEELSAEDQGKILTDFINSEEVSERMEGLSGTIVVMNNGNGVHPQKVSAKFPISKKSIPPNEAAIRFIREFKLQSKAYYHPNIHWPHNFSFHLGTPVAYFRFWEGDLSKLINKDTIIDVEKIAIIIQILYGLIHLSKLNIVCHQDLKPENIFFRDYNKTHQSNSNQHIPLTPLIGDFGSVDLFKEHPIFRGTAPYCAPEQWKDKSEWNKSDLTEKTNIFTIGIMLFELISNGYHPEGSDFTPWHLGKGKAFKNLNKESKWREWINLGCPINANLDVCYKDIFDIVKNCMEIDPKKRPNPEYLIEVLFNSIKIRSNEFYEQVKIHTNYLNELALDKNWEFPDNQLSVLKSKVYSYYNIES